ncbi:major facilitator superfamily domain-containing protein [Aspergillus flavus]|uniref:Major facilitator superfamily domain-containing protein n=4 Tax=Aspergillus subgen. Circumdati TaxID=2720871 RepID=A0A7U2MQ63_ASPFN|nr:unnamed protein product [Aspergillus oryzae RIB40]XP_041141447.1 uncharacterized protein G4B84_001689 [Aspergillus flavus NRRL3357]OOO13289.1 General substrate transporter [Aspergillus oryzae]QRD87455.1 major facilitator superfamily domain-containing protein [Aspergillus flavus]KAF7627837.1 hypothetical protein AFLA_003207 [Aspergillus flavus NRRL3357]QMW26444.1 hypothetical protein G4B84_001689 [Aspergillus flavus NRRL3357]RAQ74203.1 carboxylic acid transporter [Aspergillus flavus]
MGAEAHEKRPGGNHTPPPDNDEMEHMSIGRYLWTRLPTLVPPMNPAPNPFKALALLNRQQWLFFTVAFLGWSWDAFDFFTVSLTTSQLAEAFDKSVSDITWGITLVLMLRSVGAITFGIASDRWGRKWPFVINNVLFIVLELGTGFCQTYKQFLACRALFGIAMGGLYGNAAATALEDCPLEARGIVSGLLQQGYAFGYLLATAFARGLVDTTPHGWRPLYWFGACPPVLIILFRLCLPETNTFLQRQATREEVRGGVASSFIAEGKTALKRHWLLLIYLVLLMAGFNFMSHGSQDLYPTLLKSEFSFSANAVTVTQVVANLGALTGGTLCGWASQIFGRRFSIIVISIVGGALLYPYTFVTSTNVMAAAFFEQFCVQGAWGVIPIHLMELSPGSIRTFTVGTAYQLGNLVSSASSTIESTIGERFPLPPTETEKHRYQYGKVICIFMGCVFAYTIIVTFLGPERLGRQFDVAHDTDMAEVAAHRGTTTVGEGAESDVEKGTVSRIEG